MRALLPEKATVVQWMARLATRQSAAWSGPSAAEVQQQVEEDQKLRDKEHVQVRTPDRVWRRTTVEEYEDLARREQQEEEEDMMHEVLVQDETLEATADAYQQYQQELWLQLQGQTTGLGQDGRAPEPPTTLIEDESVDTDNNDAGPPVSPDREHS